MAQKFNYTPKQQQQIIDTLTDFLDPEFFDGQALFNTPVGSQELTHVGFFLHDVFNEIESRDMPKFIKELTKRKNGACELSDCTASFLLDLLINVNHLAGQIALARIETMKEMILQE